MRSSDVVNAWGKILKGERPSLSIEITRECPLRCPGCYAYEPAHLGGGVTLRQLHDRKGNALIEGVLEVVDRFKPLHLSIVGGDPLVRYRELKTLVPQLLQRGIHLQIVTSAFRPLPEEWAAMPRLTVAVSIDGLAAEHDKRRAPATYERILKNIAGQRITVHCTVTGPMLRQQTDQTSSYLNRFLAFWTPMPEIRRVWFSLFTPQMGDNSEEVLTAKERARVIDELLALRRKYSKLEMPEPLIREFLSPPSSPEKCVFARTTTTISADLHTRISPCQFGGKPDCSQCGCMASMGLAAIASAKLGGILPVGALFRASLNIGRMLGSTEELPRVPELRVLQ